MVDARIVRWPKQVPAIAIQILEDNDISVRLTPWRAFEHNPVALHVREHFTEIRHRQKETNPATGLIANRCDLSSARCLC